MKNKWILSFLLIALAFNAISPLLATSLDEDATILLKLNPLPAIKNCWNGFVGSASNKFNSITENASKSNVLAMLGRGAKEVGSAFSWLGSGIASLAGKIPGHYFEKPETLEGFSKSTALFDAFLGISAILIAKQYLTLNYIDWKINISTKISKSEKDKINKKFLFGSWKCEIEGYKTYHDIWNHPSVKQELLQEVKEPNSRIQILNSAKKRIAPEDVKENDIKNTLNEEKNKLRKYLRRISRLTDAPKKILELICEQSDYVGTKENSYIWYQDAALKSICLDYFKTLNAYNLEKFGNNLKEKKCKCYSYTNIKHLLFIPPGWDSLYIHRWRPGVWYKKATELYWKVYTRFLRTCALLDVLNRKSSEISQQSGFQNLLAKVDILIEGQNNINNVILAVQLIENLSKAIKIVNKLKVDYEQKNNEQKNNVLINNILEIDKHFINIAIIWKNSKISDNDISIVAGSLSCIKSKLLELIKVENK